MIGALALVGLLAAGSPPDTTDTGGRVAAAMAAEQSLQGPLDGAWTLQGADGGPLYRFELVDPAGGHGPLTGAWRDMGGVAGPFADVRRSGRTLLIDFAPRVGLTATLRLTEKSPGLWTGRMIAGNAGLVVVLRRD